MNINELSISPLNARKTVYPTDPGEQERIRSLADSIKTQGLLQNLVAYKDPEKTGYLVCAGGRRLQALQLLVAEGARDADLPVPMLEVDIEEAEEISLAENYHREPMHPADEFDAFNHLAKKGRTTLEVAARFGVDELHVKRMLKLANLAPDILHSFREDAEMTLDQVMALTVSTDHEKQLKVWNNARGAWQREPDELRKALTAGKVAATSGIGKFVGIEAYVAAGGLPEADLFSENTYLPDVALVNELALAKLEKRAVQLRKQGWSWVEVRPEFGHNDERKFKTAHREWKGGKEEPWSDKIKGYAGVVVSINHHTGKMATTEGLYRAGDDKAVTKTKTGKDGKKETVKVKPPSTDLTFAAVQRLQGFRNSVLRSQLVGPGVDTHVMLAAMAADWVRHELSALKGMLRNVAHFDRIVWVGNGNVPHDKNVRAGEELAEEAEEAFTTIHNEWLKRLSAVKGDLFEWLLAQPATVTHELLAFMASRALHAAQTQYSKDVDRGQGLLSASGIDMTSHWKPDVEWIASIQKAAVLQILSAFYDKKALQGLDKLKRDELDKRAAAMLEGKGYLPAPLRPKDFKAAWAKKAP
ncbi:MAG: ParB/RepB/Spo0J family partition protein [Pseudoxanthomonas sp.]